MEIKKIKKLVQKMEEHNFSELTLEGKDIKISMKKEKKVEVAPQQVFTQQPQVTTEVKKPAKKKVEKLIEGEKILSPMVGTFYFASAPGAEPFVKEGDSVEVGDKLCIVEAMKLMNEVKSDKKGRIAKILVKDGEPVTKGQELFVLEIV